MKILTLAVWSFVILTNLVFGEIRGKVFFDPSSVSAIAGIKGTCHTEDDETRVCEKAYVAFEKIDLKRTSYPEEETVVFISPRTGNPTFQVTFHPRTCKEVPQKGEFEFHFYLCEGVSWKYVSEPEETPEVPQN